MSKNWFSPGCRGCSECTESYFLMFLLWPLRVIWVLLTFWNIGLLKKNCPDCGHTMHDPPFAGG